MEHYDEPPTKSENGKEEDERTETTR